MPNPARHADGPSSTGPATENVRLALRKTYAAVPEPRMVVASGACAISGGAYAGHRKVCGGVVPMNPFVPGSPSGPVTFLDGLLRLPESR